LFFRALKQSLRVKTFVGTSANALKTQLWTALIAMLVVKYLQLRSTFGWSLSNLVAVGRAESRKKKTVSSAPSRGFPDSVQHHSRPAGKCLLSLKT
jgi:hypothetical protein